MLHFRKQNPSDDTLLINKLMMSGPYLTLGIYILHFCPNYILQAQRECTFCCRDVLPGRNNACLALRQPAARRSGLFRAAD